MSTNRQVKSESVKAPRRSSSGVREGHLAEGAFLIEFKEPSEPLALYQSQMPPGMGPPALLTGKELQSARDKYRTMERKGFKVTKDTGCLIPDSQYSTYQQGATFKGHQRAYTMFAHWCPKAGEWRNEFGWPNTPQISHLCHRRNCCRFDHLVIEAQWRNQKRNYCGYEGECDCGNDIRCIRRYQATDQIDTPALCETKAEVETALSDCPLEFVIHGADRFANRDKKAAQRKETKLKRKRAQEAHEHATERKQSRLGGKGSSGATDTNDNEVRESQSASEEE